MARGYPDYRYFSFPISVAEGGTGVGTLTLNGVLYGNATSQILATAAGAADAVLRVPAAGGAPAFGAVDLAKAAAVTGLLPVARGGTGTATPSLVAGTNIGITSTWPNQTVAFSGILPIANGGTATATPALVAGTNIGITGTWPAQTVAFSGTLPVASGGTGTVTGSISGTGALTFAAGGADQNITLTPSGTGATLLSTGLRLTNALISFPSSNSGDIYSTSSLGAAYPFLENGNLVLQPRSSGATRDIVLAVGNPPSIATSLVIERTGKVGIGTATPGKVLDVTGDVRASLQLISTLATGTAPLAVTSTTQVSNLNAERVAGTQVTNAATLGLLLIGSGTGTAAWATPDGARVYNSADETIGTASFTNLTFDSERYDNGGLHSTVSNTSRLTAAKAGKYLITAHIEWASNATGTRTLQIKLNASLVLARVTLPVMAAVTASMSVSTIYHLAATDYVEIQVHQDSGGNVDVLSDANLSPEFAMQWLGP